MTPILGDNRGNLVHLRTIVLLIELRDKSLELALDIRPPHRDHRIDLLRFAEQAA